MAQKRMVEAELKEAVQAYYDAAGNRSEAARALGLKRQTYASRLRAAEARLGVRLGKVADGRVEAQEAEVWKLPKKGHIQRYVITSIQNNTPLHGAAFKNLRAYSDYLNDVLDNGSCRMVVGTFSYQTQAYGAKAVKRGTYDAAKASERLWYAPEAEQYIVDRSVQLAPGLVWCGEQNILPTNRRPLTGFEDYNGRASNIVPHARIAMESVASLADEATKFNYSTGTTTQRNYIQKRQGILAERHHTYGALLVEVDYEGNWWVRQLYADRDGTIMDVGPDPSPGVLIKDGVISHGYVAHGINWGDAHAAEMELWIRELAWGHDGMLDTLRPKYQFMNDLFSMRSRGHHDMKNFHRTYSKFVEDQDNVEGEVALTADFLHEALRDWCETVVVPSNHDKHLERWLNEADFRLDPTNAKFFCLAQYAMLDAMDNGEQDFSALEWALTKALDEAGHSYDTLRFLANDESFVICKDKNGGVECGLHGHEGVNGSRGSTQSLTKLGRRINKGHDHTAAIRDWVASAGACATRFVYTSGPHSHSVTHIVTYGNGERALITMWGNRWRAC